jgi:hypothetical protein
MSVQARYNAKLEGTFLFLKVLEVVNANLYVSV